MKMDRLEIKQFRGLKDLSLKRLGDINLLLGNNDSGKTTVLEAVRMFEKPDSIDVVIRNARGRMPGARLASLDNYTAWGYLMGLFPFEQEERKEFSLRAKIDGQDKQLTISGELVHVLQTVLVEQLEFNDISNKREDLPLSEKDVLTFQGTLRTHEQEIPIEIDEHYRSKVPHRLAKLPNMIEYMAPVDNLSWEAIDALYFSTKQQESEIVELLRLIDPDIEGFKLLLDSTNRSLNQTIEHKRFGNVPLYTYGDGMKKALSLAAAILSAKGGILLVDEIETSLQASNLQHVFTWLLQACRQFQVQLFATTHSLEAVSALVSCAVKDTESELVCYRLEADSGQAFAKRFSEGDLNAMVNGRGIDVR